MRASFSFNIIVEAELGLDNSDFIDHNISLYPVPVKSSSINILNPRKISLTRGQLFDVNVKLVKSYGASELSIETISLESVSGGYYMLVLESAVGKSTHRIVKI